MFQFLQSLIKLKSAYVKLQLWFNSVGYKHTQTKTAVKFFAFGNDLYFKTVLINFLFKIFILKLQKICSTLDFGKALIFAISGPQVQCSPLKLCSWTYEFYMLLLAKFSLYFHDSLQPQCSTSDFDHTIGAMKSPNFVQIFTTFQRRTEPSFILLIANRCSAPDISPRSFYRLLVRSLLFIILVNFSAFPFLFLYE